MRNLNGFMTGVVLVMMVSVAAVAQDQKDRGGMMMDQGSMMMGGEMGKGGMMGDMCGMMMGGMMGKTMVATSDGGVIVSVGNRLYKYNKDLKLVKEGEIKIDMQQMQEKMQSMMEQCPMRQPGSPQKSTGTPTNTHGH